MNVAAKICEKAKDLPEPLAREVLEFIERIHAQQDAGVAVSDAELPEAADSGDRSGGGQIDLLLDATVTVAAQLGTASVEIRDLLQYGPGSVVQLDKKAGEPVELFLRGSHFATGTLVVVGDQLGVRIKEILPSASSDDQNAQPDSD